jgi:hypothetical protein
MDKWMVKNGMNGMPHNLAHHKAIPILRVLRYLVSGSAREVGVAEKQPLGSVRLEGNQLKVYSRVR